MNSPAQSLLGSIIRHFLSAFGLWLVSKGWTDSNTAAGIQAYAMPLAGVIITAAVLTYSHIRTLGFFTVAEELKAKFSNIVDHYESGKIVPSVPPTSSVPVSNPSPTPPSGPAVLLIPFLLFGLMSCAPTTPSPSPSPSGGTTTTPAISQGDLAIIQTGAMIATGAVLQYAESNPAQRTQLANEIYASANAAYSLTTGTIPTADQINSTIVSFAGSNPASQYTQYASALSSIYSSYFSKIGGNSANAIAILSAIAQGAQSAAKAYTTTPVPAQ